MPAVTRQSHGRGTAFHVATMPDVKLWQRILAQAAASAGIDVPATTSPGVEAVVRGDSLFLINHNPHPGAATMCHQTPTPATIELSAWETRILPLA
jgi:beta-galactosidase